MIASLKETWGWTNVGILVWPRANFRCEYCKANMLSDRRAYRSYDYDHILPKSKYQKLYTEPESRTYYPGKEWLIHTGVQYSNIALGCKRCNTLKSTWDPNASAPLVLHDAEDISSAIRAQLLERVREYLAPKWARDDAELEQVRLWAGTLRAR